SDGVTDRGNAEGELFGVERLKEAALRNRADTARIVLSRLLGDVPRWSAGKPAEGGSTLIVARFNPRSGFPGEREPERLVQPFSPPFSPLRMSQSRPDFPAGPRVSKCASRLQPCLYPRSAISHSRLEP